MRTMDALLVNLTLAVAFAAVSCFPLRAQGSTRDRSISEVVKASDGAVVLIETADSSGRPLLQGSGFMISSDGVIVTNNHVIDGASSVSVKLSNGTSFSAGFIGTLGDADLALLKVRGENLPIINLAESTSVNPGDRVIAVGSPLGLQNTVAEGIVSGLRTFNGIRYLQTSAPISHGDSGGPLLNSNGEAIGVLTFMLRGGENLNFAIAVDILKPYIPDIARRPVFRFPGGVEQERTQAPGSQGDAGPQTGTTGCNPLSYSELSKLDGHAEINYQWLSLDLYNGSACTIRTITLEVSVLERGKNKEWNPILTRVYRLDDGQYGGARPLSSWPFHDMLGFTLGRKQKFTWHIQGASGY